MVSTRRIGGQPLFNGLTARVCSGFAVWGTFRTYRTLVPGPYWPETGHAHITCKAFFVVPFTLALWTAASAWRAFGSKADPSAGMAHGL
ncbi:hypothetical protein I7I50_03208 [Histoplasma capsulatum G186AR]|uniref:Uncharacterized protein n=1 Tax=Ajellomyces capsulatus TaxID=5037 RepID=A0A8H7Z456_AJECA|nr:hypothetical protein I7I52_00124 [Histoplasma capsulatum]QSS72136.1 hypothetical protein I7I50_03208 [Histoplasma capsulatum G186AR]